MGLPSLAEMALAFAKHFVPLFGRDARLDKLTLVSVEHGERILDERSTLPIVGAAVEFVFRDRKSHAGNFSGEG